jgi:hypothetical protein
MLPGVATGRVETDDDPADPADAAMPDVLGAGSDDGVPVGSADADADRRRSMGDGA